MSRGLTDPVEPEQPEGNAEIEQVIRDIILGQNKLHDRLVQLEKEMDHLLADVKEAKPKKKWNKGL